MSKPPLTGKAKEQFDKALRDAVRVTCQSCGKDDQVTTGPGAYGTDCYCHRRLPVQEPKT